MEDKKVFKWKDKWNKTKGEILEFLRHIYTINVKLAKGTEGSLRFERKGLRIEISEHISKTVLKEWHFYYNGGWKTTGYEEFFGLSKERDAITTTLRIFMAQSVESDSFLIQYLEAID